MSWFPFWIVSPPRAWEVVVVDDGSDDRTSEVVREYAHPRVGVLHFATNRGKGAAVKSGVLATRGDVVIICDADMSTSPTMLEPFLEELQRGGDIVIGNRRDPDSSIQRQQSLIRRLLGRSFIRLSTLITSAPVTDFNCGFKLFRGAVARALSTGLDLKR